MNFLLGFVLYRIVFSFGIIWKVNGKKDWEIKLGNFYFKYLFLFFYLFIIIIFFIILIILSKIGKLFNDIKFLKMNF